MSVPRAIIPGRCYLVTRRCSERRFLLRPDQATNNAFKYCLALAAKKSGIRMVGVGTTSNHYHGVVVDNRGQLPHFLEMFHKLLAKHRAVGASTPSAASSPGLTSVLCAKTAL